MSPYNYMNQGLVAVIAASIYSPNSTAIFLWFGYIKIIKILNLQIRNIETLK